MGMSFKWRLPKPDDMKINFKLKVWWKLVSGWGSFENLMKNNEKLPSSETWMC